MTKKILAISVLCIGAAFVLTTPAHATEVTLTPNSSLYPDGSYDSPTGYDYATSFPPTSYQSIGTFNFTIPAGANVASVTISGSFGNGDVPNTALSDYYLGFGGDEEAVQVAACDSISADCYSGQAGPYTWTATLTQAEIAALEPALAAGSIDFGYTWDSSPPAQPIPDPFSPTGSDDQYVYAGAATLDITPTPELGTGVLWFSGLVGLAAFWRFRKPLTSGSPD